MTAQDGAIVLGLSRKVFTGRVSLIQADKAWFCSQGQFASGAVVG